MSFIKPGQVVWFEIGTSDLETTKDFYGHVFGWSYETDPDSSVGGRTYTRIMAPAAPWPMGAIYTDATGTDRINVSIFSTDVAADTERLVGLGATVVVPPTQVGDVTWFARLSDPQGNVFALFSRTESEELAERAEATEQQMDQTAYTPQPGQVAWFEIGTSDPQATIAFYVRAFHWRIERDETAGNAPYYNVFTGNEWPAGGMFDHSEAGTGTGADYFTPCVLSADVAVTVAEAAPAGGAIAVAPTGNPDGLVFAKITDPAKNLVGLFSMPTSGDYAH